MLSRDELESIVNTQISTIEKIGEHGSSSGHMSSVSYILNKLDFYNIENGNIKIHYTYTKYIETEFTYYTDNPPYEYNINRVMIINKKNKSIISVQPYK